MNDIYTSPKTTETFNTLLGGRWHTGFRASVAGQIELERHLAKLAGMNSESLVLDWGCGPGLVSCDYSLLTGATVVGLSDIPSHIQSGRELATKLRVPVTFVLGEARSVTLPFPDGTFDIVVFTESPCHVPIENRKHLFSEFHRVLKPGGHIVGSDWTCIGGPHCQSHKELDQAYGTQIGTPVEYRSYLRDTADIRVFTPDWHSPMTDTIIALYYKVVHGLPISSPFPKAAHTYDDRLLQAGRRLEHTACFRIVTIHVRTVI